jgi:WD40 repeat protein
MGTVRFRPGSRPFSLALSPDGKTLATGEDGVVRLWDLATGKETRSFAYPDLFWVRWLTFSPDGKRLAVLGDHKDSMHWQPYDHSLFVCEANTGRVLYQFREEAGGFTEPWFSPDGKLLGAGKGGAGRFARPRKLTFWEADTGKELRALDDVYWWAWSPDGKILAGTGMKFDSIYLWDVATGKELHRLPGHPPGTALAFSPDGKTLAAANYGGPSMPKEEKQDTAIHLLDVATGKERLKITGRWQGLDLLAFSPDGATLAARDWEGGVVLWEVSTGKPRPRTGSRKDDYPYTFTFTHDGKRLIWCPAGALRE